MLSHVTRPRCANWSETSESVPPCGYSRAPSRTVGLAVLSTGLRRTRWSPHWPVLPTPAVPTHPADARRHRPLSDRRQPFLAAPRSPARCAATAIPVAPGLLVVVVSLRSRRCSRRQKLQPLMSESTSQTPTLVGRFSGDPHWPLLGDP